MMYAPFFDSQVGSIPLVITDDDHTIRVWRAGVLGPAPTITGSRQAFGSLIAHHIAHAYHPHRHEEP